MYSTRALATPYSTPFLPVNMRGRGLRVYQGGQRGNGIGGLFKPLLTRAVIPLAKRVVVPLAKRALPLRKLHSGYKRNLPRNEKRHNRTAAV